MGICLVWWSLSVSRADSILILYLAILFRCDNYIDNRVTAFYNVKVVVILLGISKPLICGAYGNVI